MPAAKLFNFGEGEHCLILIEHWIFPCLLPERFTYSFPLDKELFLGKIKTNVRSFILLEIKVSLNKSVLRFNALFLILIGSLQMLFELLSHFAGIGPLADRFNASPYTIGFFEAHGLAILMGILLWRASAEPQKFWHGFAVVVHVLLGGANLLFWDSFVQLNVGMPGSVATIVHGVFIVSESYCAWRKG